MLIDIISADPFVAANATSHNAGQFCGKTWPVAMTKQDEDKTDKKCLVDPGATRVYAGDTQVGIFFFCIVTVAIDIFVWGQTKNNDNYDL